MLKAPPVIVGIGLLLAATSSWADTSRVAQAASVPTGPGVGTAAITNLRGTITAIDREKKTVTVTGEQGRRVVLDVHQPATFDVIKVGDPVVATYMETVVIQARKAGTGNCGKLGPDTAVRERDEQEDRRQQREYGPLIGAPRKRLAQRGLAHVPRGAANVAQFRRKPVRLPHVRLFRHRRPPACPRTAGRQA